MENLEISSCRTGDSAGYDRVWAQIDMDAVLFNMESMRANIREDVKIVAVLKTNGYGHGAVAYAKIFSEKGFLYISIYFSKVLAKLPPLQNSIIM